MKKTIQKLLICRLDELEKKYPQLHGSLSLADKEQLLAKILDELLREQLPVERTPDEDSL